MSDTQLSFPGAGDSQTHQSPGETTWLNFVERRRKVSPIAFQTLPAILRQLLKFVQQETGLGEVQVTGVRVHTQLGSDSEPTGHFLPADQEPRPGRALCKVGLAGKPGPSS